jgi:hypothetical protein
MKYQKSFDLSKHTFKLTKRFILQLKNEEPIQIGTRNIVKEQVDVNLNVKSGSVPLNHPDAEKWLYLDPQNQIQGTFTSEEMAGWFAAGYFTLNLMIRRGCDDQFLPLGKYQMASTQTLCRISRCYSILSYVKEWY